MYDLLKDIVSHTHNLGFLELVKINGTDDSTSIDSISEDKKVILYGKFNNPVPELKGEFGMAQMNKLKIHLDCPLYKENSKISVTKGERNGNTVLTGIHFENEAGDFKNDYRFMSGEVVKEQMKSLIFREPQWNVDITPSISAIQRFTFQAQANTEHKTFVTKTENGNLKFIFGDLASHGGEFIFATNVKGVLANTWSWPVSNVLSILKLVGSNNTTLSISNAGMMRITVDSGIATYKYLIPANT